MILLQQKNQLAKVMETNEMSARYGLALTEQEAELLVSERIQTLRAERRVEFGPGILPRVIEEFGCRRFFIFIKMKCMMRFPTRNYCIL